MRTRWEPQRERREDEKHLRKTSNKNSLAQPGHELASFREFLLVLRRWGIPIANQSFFNSLPPILRVNSCGTVTFTICSTHCLLGFDDFELLHLLCVEGGRGDPTRGRHRFLFESLMGILTQASARSQQTSRTSRSQRLPRTRPVRSQRQRAKQH